MTAKPDKYDERKKVCDALKIYRKMERTTGWLQDDSRLNEYFVGYHSQGLDIPLIIKKLLKKHERINVLEVGPGKGIAGKEIREKHGDKVDYIGLGLTSGYADLLRDSEFRVGHIEMEKLPFNTDFHLIFSEGALAYALNHEKTLKRLLSLLKPGGNLVAHGLDLERCKVRNICGEEFSLKYFSPDEPATMHIVRKP